MPGFRSGFENVQRLLSTILFVTIINRVFPSRRTIPGHAAVGNTTIVNSFRRKRFYFYPVHFNRTACSDVRVLSESVSDTVGGASDEGGMGEGGSEFSISVVIFSITGWGGGETEKERRKNGKIVESAEWYWPVTTDLRYYLRASRSDEEFLTGISFTDGKKSNYWDHGAVNNSGTRTVRVRLSS